MVNKCLKLGNYTNEWRTAYITYIFKGENENVPSCYRGFSITSSISRLYLTRTAVGGKISEEQSGFIPGRGCTDNVFTLHQLLEKTNQEVHLAVIYLKQAYDSRFIRYGNYWKLSR